jgi:hypothetical protein
MSRQICDGVELWPNAVRHGPDAPFPYATKRVTYKVSHDEALFCSGCFQQEFERGRLEAWETLVSPDTTAIS